MITKMKSISKNQEIPQYKLHIKMKAHFTYNIMEPIEIKNFKIKKKIQIIFVNINVFKNMVFPNL